MINFIKRVSFFILLNFYICGLFPAFSMMEAFTTSKKGMIFQLGLEFQEISSLCKWAVDDYNIQKKPLFIISYRSKPLWHVVIDTNDIEFVTVPFPKDEEEKLGICIDSISKSFQLLVTLLNENKQITFLDWANNIESVLSDSKFSVSFTDEYELAKNKNITRPVGRWEPKFSPQATIQHPLEWTIPLYFGLFGFDSPTMMAFTSSLPDRDTYSSDSGNKKYFKKIEKKYKNKTNGLIFLHALTLFQMKADEDDTDESLLEKTLNDFTKFYQVDAKMNLSLMSRRPFSSMWQDINLNNLNYSDCFILAMTQNNNYTELFNVPNYFNKTNYAEQFIDVNPEIFKEFILNLDEEFVEKNREILNELLSRHIISTVMLRNINIKGENSEKATEIRDWFDNYHTNAINTVQDPSKRCIVNLDMQPELIASNYDCLSPPCLLDSKNSMGALRKENLTEEDIKKCGLREIDIKKYGEAIIEVRGIEKVQSWFLEKCKLPAKDVLGHFLTNPVNLSRDVKLLFKFLKKFGSKDDMENIFCTHIPSAVHKY